MSDLFGYFTLQNQGKARLVQILFKYEANIWIYVNRKAKLRPFGNKDKSLSTFLIIFYWHSVSLGYFLF